MKISIELDAEDYKKLVSWYEQEVSYVTKPKLMREINRQQFFGQQLLKRFNDCENGQ